MNTLHGIVSAAFLNTTDAEKIDGYDIAVVSK